MYKPHTISNLLIIFLLFAVNFSIAQTVKLEQGQNGGVDNAPVSPVNWATGNSNSGNSHFSEGQSIPYRLTISKLRAGSHFLEIEWDTKKNSKNAIDYITSFNRICEAVIPSSGTPRFGSIPAPNGIPQPSSSFNQLSDAERKIAIYGGTLGEIKYVLQENNSATSAITRLRISFTTSAISGSNNTVVIAWGGHIASAKDWGAGNSASSISGSPYHTRIASFNGKSVGTQSRSVEAVSDVIDLDTDCQIQGQSEVCAGSSASYSVPAGASTYSWAVSTGGEITSGAGTNSITVKWTTAGSISVNVGNEGSCFPSQCSLNVTLTTPPTLSVVDAVLCSTENRGNTSIADLNDYVSVDFGNLIFKRNNQTIGTPEVVLVTDGDVIEVSVIGNCGSTKSFTVKVNDRQDIGICALGKVYEPIGAQLSSLYDIYKRGQTVESNEVFYISGNEVLIEVIYFKDKFEEAKAILQGLRFNTPDEEELKQDPSSSIIAGFFPISNLLLLNDYPEVINSVSQAIPGVPNKGATTTQGDRVMRSNLVRAGYVHSVGDQAIDGTGIKIGVLSDSYNKRRDAGVDGVNTLDTDISNGDLPASLYFLRDLPSRFGNGTDEGRAMMQIIHDVAPGAQLGFRTGVVTSGDFAQGIRDLAAAGSDIIVDDITYITEPFFRDGKVAKAVNEVTANGVSYFTSAGNFGSKSFEGVFTPVSDPSIGLPLNSGEWIGLGRVNQFSGGSTTQSIKVFPGQNGPAVYMIALQWDDPLYSIDQIGSLYDLDIYLKDFGVPLFGFNRNNANGDPIEILSFTITEPTTVDLLIARECASCTDIDSNTGIKFKYVVFRGELDPNDQNGINASTIIGHANSDGAMTVGAVLYANTSVFGFDPTLVPSGTERFTVASFSSKGGTLTNGVIRNKPDFTAPNGVNTTVNLGAPNLEGDRFPNFFGTSAAAPHAAAIAALVKQARLKYYPSTNPQNWVGGVGASLPADIRRVLKTTAQDMHETGFDIKSGSGLVRADRALLSLAAPNPDNIELVYEDGVNPGKVEFKLRINGTNFYEGSNVYLREELLISTYEIDDQGFGYLEVNIPKFVGNPGITVVNNAISDSELDGGTAGPVTFLDVVKKTVAIRADDVSKKYAQILAPFTARVYERVDNNWVLSALTLEEVGLTLNPENNLLQQLSLSRPISGDLADAGTYVITASHPPIGVAFSDFFNYVGVLQEDGNLLYDGINNALGNYGPGIITVEPLPITIKPVDLTVKYNESISDALEFEVLIQSESEENIEDVPGLKNGIITQYFQDLDSAKKLGDTSLPLGVFNGQVTLDKVSFNNKSFMVSSGTIINARVQTIVNILRSKVIVNSAYDVPASSFLTFLDPNQENQELKPVSINNKIINSARTIINSNLKTIINDGKIINANVGLNGLKVIVNSDGGEEDTEDNSLVIFSEKDLEGAIEGENQQIGKYYDFGVDTGENNDDFNLEFFSVNVVTGTGVGNHFIIPGTFKSRNFKVSYLPADLTITPATLTAKTSANPAVIKFGDTAPQFATEFTGFEVSTSFFDRTGNKVTLNDDKESVINSVAYSLVIGSASFPSTGTIAIGTYSIRPQATFFTPANYIVDLENSTFGSLSVTGCVNKAPIIGSFKTAKGSGGTSNPATIARPEGTQTGDLLIVGLMFEKGQAPSVTPPGTDWILIQRVNQLNQVAMITYYKVAKSNEPLTYGFRINQSPKWTMGITRVSGADVNHRDGPIVAFSGASGSPALIATAPSLTTTYCNTMVMTFYTNKKNATWTPRVGTIEVYDDPNNQQGLTSNMMSYYIQSDPGPTGNLSATASMSENWVAQAIAIRPLAINPESARTKPLPGERFTELSISEGISTLQLDDIPGELKAFPNPVKDRMNLILRGLVEEEPNESSLVILDAMGRSHQLPRTWYENESRLELDFSEMHVGFYIINIKTLNGVKSIRVIKKSR